MNELQWSNFSPEKNTDFDMAVFLMWEGAKKTYSTWKSVVYLIKILFILNSELPLKPKTNLKDDACL